MSNTKALNAVRRPFTITPHAAIQHLKESGNWPVNITMFQEEAASDYWVLAAFWEWPEELKAYLDGTFVNHMAATLA